MRRLVLVLAIAVPPVAGFACSSAPATCDNPTATITVDMQDLRFAPDCVAATPGSTLQLVNHDDAPHTFTVRGTDVDVKIDGGQTASAELTGVAAGTYEVTCLYHPEMTERLQVG